MSKQIIMMITDEGKIGYESNITSKTELLGLIEVCKALYVKDAILAIPSSEKPNGKILTLPPGVTL